MSLFAVDVKSKSTDFLSNKTVDRMTRCGINGEANLVILYIVIRCKYSDRQCQMSCDFPCCV